MTEESPTSSAELALVDGLIDFMTNDLELEEAAQAPPAQAVVAAPVARYDVLASLGWLVSVQAKAGADERRAAQALQILAQAYLDAAPSDTASHDRISAGLSSLNNLSSLPGMDALFDT